MAARPPAAPRKRGSSAEASAQAKPLPLRPESRERAGTGKPPPFRPPQLATLVDHVPAGSGWLHEMKYDGYRCDARDRRREGQGLYPLRARLDRQFAADRRGGADAGRGLGADRRRDRRLDDEGQHQLLGAPAGDQRRRPRASPSSLFDLLEHRRRGPDELPNIERKERLAALLVGAGKPPAILYAEHIVGHGEKLFDGHVRGRPGRRSSRSAPTPPIAATGPRAGSRSNAPSARNSSSSAGRRATRRAAASARSCSASTRMASCATPARSAPASRCRSQHDLRARMDRLATDKTPRSSARGRRRAARIGSSRSWSPRSPSPNSPPTMSCATPASSACAATRRRPRWCPEEAAGAAAHRRGTASGSATPTG